MTEETQLQRMANTQLAHHEEQRHALRNLNDKVDLIVADVSHIKESLRRDRRASQADPAELERDAGAVMLGAQQRPSLWVRATHSRAALAILTALATIATTAAAQYAATHAPTQPTPAVSTP
jgi:hypothetical protein